MPVYEAVLIDLDIQEMSSETVREGETTREARKSSAKQSANAQGSQIQTARRSKHIQTPRCCFTTTDGYNTQSMSMMSRLDPLSSATASTISLEITMA